MRHLKSTAKLGRTFEHRNAMLANMVCSLIKHKRVITTLAKAKAVRGEAERLITIAKKGRLANRMELAKRADAGDTEAARELARSLHCRRQVASYLYDREVVNKVFDVTALRYQDRPGGYTRIIRAGFRRGDAAEMAILQLV